MTVETTLRRSIENAKVFILNRLSEIDNEIRISNELDERGTVTGLETEKSNLLKIFDELS